MSVNQRDSRRIIVLKFGGSVLARESDIANAVHECYRWVRDGWAVVATVSAIGDATDRLVSAASFYGHSSSPHAAAALISTGESVSAAHLWLGCDRAGLDAVAADPREIQLSVTGPADDAIPSGVHAARLRSMLNEHDVVIVPGFFGIDDQRRIALLGRGGSDLTAVLLAHALSARCRLLKDVRGLYERDPSRPGPFARRYADVTFHDAAPLAGEILQRKALAYAERHEVPFEVSALQRRDATIVGSRWTRFAEDARENPTRVALLGLGVVGRGVLEHLLRSPRDFAITGVAVQSPKRHAEAISPRMLTRDAVALAQSEESDVVIEMIGGTGVARTAIEAALRRGAHVITANKSLLAAHGATLDALAAAHGATLSYSAAVGGAAPMLEFAARLHDRGVSSFASVLNGTTNCILGACAQGAAFEDALANAQALGYAESDPTADLSGLDAAEKLRLLCRIAFGRDPDALEVEGLDPRATYSPHDRLVARARRHGKQLTASVRLERLEDGHPLLDAIDAGNVALFTTLDGELHLARGRGAGRYPTAEAVFADLLQIRRNQFSVTADLNALVGGAA